MLMSFRLARLAWSSSGSRPEPKPLRYDTSRLIKVLDTTLANVRAALDDAAPTSMSAMSPGHVSTTGVQRPPEITVYLNNTRPPQTGIVPSASSPKGQVIFQDDFASRTNKWDDTYGAGRTSYNLALMLARAGRQHDALDWAHAALRDFHNIGASATQDINNTDQLIQTIQQDLKTGLSDTR